MKKIKIIFLIILGFIFMGNTIHAIEYKDLWNIRGCIDKSKYPNSTKLRKCQQKFVIQDQLGKPSGAHFIQIVDEIDQKLLKAFYVFKNGDAYSGDWKDGKMTGFGQMDYKTEYFSDTHRYVGHFINGKPDGQGKMIMPNGDTFEGEFGNGLMNGFGKYINNANDYKLKPNDVILYEGEWLNSRFTGHGRAEYSNGDVFDGSWAHGNWHGKGKLIYSHGETFSGTFHHGKPKGYASTILRDGTIVSGNVDGDYNFFGIVTREKTDGTKQEEFWENNTTFGIFYLGRWILRGEDYNIFEFNEGTYSGELKEDVVRHGKGKMVYNNGTIYEGGWANDRKNGKGVYTFRSKKKVEHYWQDGIPATAGTIIYQDGGNYIGGLNFDLRNGKGTMTYGSGDLYIGSWKDDKREGQGEYYDADGSYYVGEFYKGDFSGKGEITYPNELSYTGEWAKGKPNGYGTVKLANGTQYTGSFLEGLKSGNGSQIWPTGEKYEGSYLNDKFHGFGEYNNRNGDTYSGQWVRGKRNGWGLIIYKDKSVRFGFFKDDKLNGEGIMSLKNGNWVGGNFIEDALNGVVRNYDKKGKFINASKYYRNELVEPDLKSEESIKLFGIGIDQNIFEQIFILNLRKYKCGNQKNNLLTIDPSSILDWQSTRLICSKGDSNIEIEEEKLRFSCGNFNACSYSTSEFADQLLNRKLVNNFKYSEIDIILDEYIYYLDRYCGNGLAGDRLCVQETMTLFSPLTNTFPVEVTIEKGTYNADKEFKID